MNHPTVKGNVGKQVDVLLKRDDKGQIIPVDQRGRILSGVINTSTRYGVDETSTITIEIYHCGWLDEQA